MGGSTVYIYDVLLSIQVSFYETSLPLPHFPHPFLPSPHLPPHLSPFSSLFSQLPTLCADYCEVLWHSPSLQIEMP